MKKKLCVAVWVYGRKYQGWIPIFIYSLKKNYPDYDIKIFVDRGLSLGIKRLLHEFNLNELADIRENVIFNYKYFYKKADVERSCERRCYRWLINGEKEFEDYEYVYIGDIDIYIVKEKISLLEQHIHDLENGNGMYSNAVRLTLRDYKKNKLTARKGWLFKLTGLHFVKVSEYFEKTARWRKRITRYMSGRRIRFIDKVLFDDDERFLWILTFLSRIEFPNHSYELSREAFRPHHGVHFGEGREYEAYKRIMEYTIWNDERWMYFNEFQREYNSDPTLRKLIFSSPFYIVNIVKRTCEIVDATFDENSIEFKQINEKSNPLAMLGRIE